MFPSRPSAHFSNRRLQNGGHVVQSTQPDRAPERSGWGSSDGTGSRPHYRGCRCMPEPLTERQRQILQFIKDEIRTKGYPPSVREIGEAIGLSSSSTVHGHMTRLEEKGYIRRDPTKPRAIEVLDGSHTQLKRTIAVPMVGRVTVGQPILAQEAIEDHFPLPADFVRADESELFFLTVQGDSMIDAGILDGDYVLVHRQQHAEQRRHRRRAHRGRGHGQAVLQGAGSHPAAAGEPVHGPDHRAGLSDPRQGGRPGPPDGLNRQAKRPCVSQTLTQGRFRFLGRIGGRARRRARPPGAAPTPAPSR